MQLDGREKAAQIARYSPDGKYLIVTSYDALLATIFDAKLETQKLLQLGRGPMNMAFHPDGRILLIANHDAGSLAVIDLEMPARAEPPCGARALPRRLPMTEATTGAGKLAAFSSSVYSAAFARFCSAVNMRRAFSHHSVAANAFSRVLA